MSFVADIFGAKKQADAAKDAANTQAQASREANATQLQMFNQSRQDSEPWRQAGLAAMGPYMAMLGLGGGLGQAQQPTTQGYNSSGITAGTRYGNIPQYKLDQFGGDVELMGGLGRRGNLNGLSTGALGGAVPLGSPQASPMSAHDAQQAAFAQFRATPGYQFGLDEGMKSVQASAAARGGLNSGAALKSLMKFGNDYADQQGYTPYMNRLASLMGVGQTQAQQNATLGQNYANAVGQNLNNAAESRAKGIYGSANAWSNAASNAGSSLGKGVTQLLGGGGWGGFF